MSETPAIPKDLLDALEKRYPERTPDPEWSDREIWIKVGERRVVRALRAAFQRQTENVLRDTYVLSQTPEVT